MYQEQVAEGNVFGSIVIQNGRPCQSDHIFAKGFDDGNTQNKIVKYLQKNIPRDLITTHDTQEDYELYKLVQTVLSKVGIEVPQTSLTGLLISRHLITLLCKGEQQAVTLLEYD